MSNIRLTITRNKEQVAPTESNIEPIPTSEQPNHEPNVELEPIEKKSFLCSIKSVFTSVLGAYL
jgi:hypothetical protein